MIASQRQHSQDFSKNSKYVKKDIQLIQNNFSQLFSGKWTVLGINIMDKKYVELKSSL